VGISQVAADMGVKEGMTGADALNIFRAGPKTKSKL